MHAHGLSVSPSFHDEMSLIGFIIGAEEDSVSKTNLRIFWRGRNVALFSIQKFPNVNLYTGEFVTPGIASALHFSLSASLMVLTQS